MQLFQILIFIIFLILKVRSSLLHSLLNETVNVCINVANIRSKNNYDTRHLDEYYDFIIVGSGSAGSVLANRLSEVQQWKVLLLEAGTPVNDFNKIPLVCPLYQLTRFNWGYFMEHQENMCLGMYEERCPWPRGFALGGTSTINYMIYTRGKPTDYNRWSKMGNPGWDYNNVLPYFLKSENGNFDGSINPQYHHKGGYQSVGHPYKSELTKAFIKSGQILGYEANDYNSPTELGFSQIQATIRKGKRNSVASAFLDPVKQRPNLHILTKAKVIKILMKGKQAIGVQFIHNSQIKTAQVKKEVIISAGTFESPKLLMLTGIGPQEHLEELQIPLLHNLPVGQSLYDHISYIGLAYRLNKTITPATQALLPSEIIKFTTNGKGVYTSLGGIEALAYIKTRSAINDSPDIELILSAAGAMSTDYGLVVRRSLNIRQDLYDKLYKHLESTPTFSVFPMLTQPLSKGYLKLRSKSPFDHPKLYGNFYSDPENIDINRMVQAIRFINKMVETEPFQKFGAKLDKTPIPGCLMFRFDSDDYWECALRHLSMTLHHQIGTCRMGPKNDPEAIVDNRLRVHGIKNLRVADCSVIPTTLSAHTNAPAIMIGEKASDMIKEDWNVL